jgi:DNA repair photolyase
MEKTSPLLLLEKNWFGRTVRIYRKRDKNAALARQKKINAYNFPFTLNTVTGCLFNCRYCYLQAGFYKKHSKFGEEMIIKEGLLSKLKSNLKRFRSLPQHLRRVQIGPATEIYHPVVIPALEQIEDSGLMSRVLTAFLSEQEAGYPWAIHVITKSPLMLKDIELMKRLVCLQAEITLTSTDDKTGRIWEENAPTVSSRFELIKRLSGNGIFVRVMAMPLFPKPEVVEGIRKNLKDKQPEDVADAIEKARWADGAAIWERAKKGGALAFKAKGMNYFDPQQLNDKGEPAKKVKGRNEDPNKEMLIHSGELVRNPNGAHRVVQVQTWWYEPSGTKKRVFKSGLRNREMMDFGYSLMETARGLNWGDCA